MKIESLRFIQLHLPFKGEFTHARKSRAYSDTILVQIKDESGNSGWGEILARPYVTGESTAQIMAYDCAEIAPLMAGLQCQNQGELQHWVEQQLPLQSAHLALFGGIEMALWNLLAQSAPLELDTLIGPARTDKPGHCSTVGFDAQWENLRSRVLLAHMRGSSVIKLKVGQSIDTDIERVSRIAELIEGRNSDQPNSEQSNGNDAGKLTGKRHIRLRLDGNASLSLQDALALLHHCKHSGISIESFEEPLNHDDGDLVQKLRELHQRTGIALLADESVCSIADAAACIENQSFQLFNIRLGKHGGLVASSQVRDMALAAGIGLVGGSMVGESGILTQLAELFLRHSQEIDYIEGLGQNRTWLSIDPVKPIQSVHSEFKPFEFRQTECQELIQTERSFS